MSKVHEIITDRIVAALEKGVVPWKMPWSIVKVKGGMQNFKSKRSYNGINVFMTWITAYAKGYTLPYWVTFKQAKELGGSVKKGESGTPIIFYKRYEKENDKGEIKESYAARYFTVFNIEQTTIELPADLIPETYDFEPMEKAQAIADDMPEKPEVRHGGNSAYYHTVDDFVQMPDENRFQKNAEYYSTLFHELSHSTGHEKRLNRKREETADVLTAGMDYGKEELVAEMSAAFLCAESGVESTLENSAAYIDGWLRKLKNPKNAKLVVQAASQAQKATNFILGVNHE